MKIFASNGESLQTASYRYMYVSLYGEWGVVSRKGRKPARIERFLLA